VIAVSSTVFWDEKNAASKRNLSCVYLFSIIHVSKEKRNTAPKFPKTKILFSCVHTVNLQMHFKEQSLLLVAAALKLTVS
jgi:hypothetical protein